MAHASGAIMLLMSSLWISATTTIVPIFDAAAVLDTWEQSGATFYMALPTLVRALLTEQHANPRCITSGRLAICGGDTVPVPLQHEYAVMFGHPLVEGFGMTEGLPMLANRPETNRPGSMGRPLGDIELRVVEGEMWVRGSGIATGYWGDSPFEDSWLKTGDLVEIDAHGFVWFHGRKKEIIVRGGSNISPQEVEETLYQHPAVAEAGVIGEPDGYWGEVVLAYVALSEGHTVTAEELVAFARQHLAEYKCPQRVLFLAGLPKGPTGKVQRRALLGRAGPKCSSMISDYSLVTPLLHQRSRQDCDRPFAGLPGASDAILCFIYWMVSTVLSRIPKTPGINSPTSPLAAAGFPGLHRAALSTQNARNLDFDVDGDAIHVAIHRHRLSKFRNKLYSRGTSRIILRFVVNARSSSGTSHVGAA